MSAKGVQKTSCVGAIRIWSQKYQGLRPYIGTAPLSNGIVVSLDWSNVDRAYDYFEQYVIHRGTGLSDREGARLLKIVEALPYEGWLISQTAIQSYVRGLTKEFPRIMKVVL